MSPQPHEEVLGLCTAGFAARCLHIVADLGVADHIDDAPSPIGTLAAACEVDADALGRVLRLLSAYGIFERHPDGYRHTPSSRLLRSDHPQSLRPFARMMGLPVIWGSLTALEHSVRTGRPGLETLEPKGFWAYLQDHPAEADIFGRAMTAKSGAEIAAVLAAYDFSRFATIADIGGGRGHLLRAVLDATPAANGVLFDLPEVIHTLDVEHPRMTTTAGDFFTDAFPPPTRTSSWRSCTTGPTTNASRSWGRSAAPEVPTARCSSSRASSRTGRPIGGPAPWTPPCSRSPEAANGRRIS